MVLRHKNINTFFLEIKQHFSEFIFIDQYLVDNLDALVDNYYYHLSIYHYSEFNHGN